MTGSSSLSALFQLLYEASEFRPVRFQFIEPLRGVESFGELAFVHCVGRECHQRVPVEGMARQGVFQYVPSFGRLAGVVQGNRQNVTETWILGRVICCRGEQRHRIFCPLLADQTQTQCVLHRTGFGIGCERAAEYFVGGFLIAGGAFHVGE